MSIDSKKRWLVAGVTLIFALAVAWLSTTDSVAVWPIRNTLQYHLLSWWWAAVGKPAVGEPGTLRGSVKNEQGEPIANAWVLVARWDGTTYSARSDAQGQYVIRDVPSGSYRPVAGASGYESIRMGGLWGQVEIEAQAQTVANVVLPVKTDRTVVPGTDLSLGEPKNLSCETPIESSAIRRQVHFESDGQPNQLTFYYTPVTATTTSQLPILVVIYPGPVESWECVSLPLAAAGYMVLAVGPAYSFDLERVIDELERLLVFAREGRFPGSDESQIALLGGSYSSLHVQRLLQRGQDVKGAMLMGPPTDLFDMRRRLEEGSFIPPFGLDRAFHALGFPDREPLRYWRYSGAYHVSPDFPPTLLLHSRTDEVVPYQQSELLMTQLNEAGVPYESYFFEGGGHYLLAADGDVDALEMYRITLDFLARHLQ